MIAQQAWQQHEAQRAVTNQERQQQCLSIQADTLVDEPTAETRDCHCALGVKRIAGGKARQQARLARPDPLFFSESYPCRCARHCDERVQPAEGAVTQPEIRPQRTGE